MGGGHDSSSDRHSCLPVVRVDPYLIRPRSLGRMSLILDVNKGPKAAHLLVRRCPQPATSQFIKLPDYWSFTCSFALLPIYSVHVRRPFLSFLPTQSLSLSLPYTSLPSPVPLLDPLQLKEHPHRACLEGRPVKLQGVLLGRVSSRPDR